MLANSLYRKKPAKPIKHIVASRMLARDLSVRASSAMIFSISAVNGAFLVVGLANDLLSLSNTDWTNGSAVGDGSPAME